MSTGRKELREVKRAIHPKYFELKAEQERLLSRRNRKTDFYNGIFDRYEYPVLTREHVPLTWRYDLNAETNPYFEERLGINAVFNAGAIYHDHKYCLVARIEGSDRKSFFAVAESGNGTDGFRFTEYPVQLEDLYPEEVNVYDMRLTSHEDGWIYGVFCSESKDTSVNDLSAAVAAAGIVRTKDLRHWERLPNLVTKRSPQQRNVVLHPEFVDGKYAFYLSRRRYHQITEAKNGECTVPVRGKKGWLHIAHGVRMTAAGLRYVLYAYATSFEDPSVVIAEPGGLLLGPRGEERVGDVSNVVFSNGAILEESGRILLYYASSDTRVHVAETSLERLEDYIFHTPQDPGRSPLCVQQRCGLIRRNLELLEEDL